MTETSYCHNNYTHSHQCTTKYAECSVVCVPDSECAKRYIANRGGDVWNQLQQHNVIVGPVRTGVVAPVASSPPNSNEGNSRTHYRNISSLSFAN